METELDHSTILLLTGTLIGVSLLIKSGFQKIGLPALVGYLLIGFTLRSTNLFPGVVGKSAATPLNFLADIGVVALLFRVGLESDFQALISQLRNASGVWFGNVLLSGLLGYLTANVILGYPLVPSLYIAVALTATSVAVPVAVWREAKALNSSDGNLLLDAAELDDVSAILLMSLLFAIVPILLSGENGALVPTILETTGKLTLKLLIFGGFCYLYSKFFEHRITRLFERLEPMPDPMLMLVSTAFLIAAFAGLLGFSIALGAFFAGLVYSQDPEAAQLSRPFAVLYDLFTPFFFIVIGMNIDPQLIMMVMLPGLMLFVAAVLGKVVGTMLPASPRIGWAGSFLIGLSMVPRAEITMIVMRHGQSRGEDVVPPEAYAAMVLVSAATCLLPPLILRPLIARKKQAAEADENDG